MRKIIAKSVLLSAAAMSLFVWSTSWAGICHMRRTDTLIAIKGKTRTVATQQANNTWDDWIWRGYQHEIRCPRNGTISCSQTISVARTTGYEWDVGASFNPGSIPVIGGALSFLGLNGSYGRNSSMTTRYDRTITVQPGWGMYPIQVVVRRWVGGVFQGADRRDPNTRCTVGVGQPVGNWWYNWDGNPRFGNWATNREERRFDSWHTFRI